MAHPDPSASEDEEMASDCSTIYDTDNNTESKPEEDEKLDVARRETQAVFGVRFLIFIILLLAALAVSIIVYIVTSRSQQHEYETQYEGAYKKVQSSFVDIVKIKLGAISTLGVAMMAFGDGENDRAWPFVTLPKFQQRASAVRSQSGALYVHVNPMVTLEQRKDWMNYASSQENQWM